jgi:hypothetical protein
MSPLPDASDTSQTYDYESPKIESTHYFTFESHAKDEHDSNCPPTPPVQPIGIRQVQPSPPFHRGPAGYFWNPKDEHDGNSPPTSPVQPIAIRRVEPLPPFYQDRGPAGYLWNAYLTRTGEAVYPGSSCSWTTHSNYPSTSRPASPTRHSQFSYIQDHDRKSCSSSPDLFTLDL